MIVLEGCDMAGKSTLAQALFELIPAYTHGKAAPMVRHFTKPPKDFDKYWGYHNCVQRDVILDRFHMSQLVYRRVSSENHTLTPFKYDLVDAAITRVGGIVVVLCPPDDIIVDRWSKMTDGRKEMYSLDFVLKVNCVYQHLVKAGADGTFIDGQGAYKPKIDLAFQYNTPTEDMARDIASLWWRNQCQLNDIATQRLFSLD